MNTLIALFLIVFEAIPEALADRGKKTLAGILEFFYRAAVTCAVFALINGYQISNLPNGDLLRVLIGYVFLRYAIFDLIYNSITVTVNPLFYTGNTKIYDKIQRWLVGKWGYTIILVTKGIAGFWGFVWLMGWQDGIRF